VEDSIGIDPMPRVGLVENDSYRLISGTINELKLDPRSHVAAC